MVLSPKRIRRKLWFGPVKICDVEGCTQDTQLHMPPTNEQIIVMLFPCTPTLSADHRHILALGTNTEIGTALLSLQSLSEIISVSTQRPLAWKNIQTHAAQGYSMNKSKPSQDKLPDTERTGSRIPFTAAHGDSRTSPHKLVLWNTMGGKDPPFFSLGTGETQGRCQERWYSGT